MDRQLADWLAHSGPAAVIFLLVLAVLTLVTGRFVVPRWTLDEEKERVAALEAELAIAREEADGLRDRLFKDRQQKRRALGAVDQAIKRTTARR